jgi:hypothetical protein
MLDGVARYSASLDCLIWRRAVCVALRVYETAQGRIAHLRLGKDGSGPSRARYGHLFATSMPAAMLPPRRDSLAPSLTMTATVRLWSAKEGCGCSCPPVVLLGCNPAPRYLSPLPSCPGRGQAHDRSGARAWSPPPGPVVSPRVHPLLAVGRDTSRRLQGAARDGVMGIIRTGSRYTRRRA